VRASSAKSKGRRLQQYICQCLLDIGSRYGLEKDDLKSCSMGSGGLDVQMSPAARKVFGNLAIEAKNRESLNVTTVFWEHSAKYNGLIPILVSKKNKAEPIVTLRFSDFLDLLAKGLNGKVI
jgi:hypothetical protein